MLVVSLNECLSFSWEFHELHESLLPLSFGAFVTLPFQDSPSCNRWAIDDPTKYVNLV